MKTMNRSAKRHSLIEALAKGYAAEKVGISTSLINKALRKERSSETCDTAVSVYRSMVKQLEQVLHIQKN